MCRPLRAVARVWMMEPNSICTRPLHILYKYYVPGTCSDNAYLTSVFYLMSVFVLHESFACIECVS